MEKVNTHVRLIKLKELDNKKSSVVKVGEIIEGIIPKKVDSESYFIGGRIFLQRKNEPTRSLSTSTIIEILKPIIQLETDYPYITVRTYNSIYRLEFVEYEYILLT